ncbi:GNAT family N-acetyltransferase [Micromonospora sp. NBC_01813]|uniref:GNAT family N-acetyltransferase n=1 Tax=Micromonospora sp. NBC_01813 TaxID=2975988 RepID=UPI002DDB9F3B|nr:GNAT family N-acetyltransferase [Micromonospora sp. NBC_01813]WSA09739.1 GNAT family N-acetyltransferase [Micromonospora sp. NBC_01813]
MANQENALLDRLDRFCDAVPRAAAHPEELGEYVLFVRKEEGGWPFYARPRRGAAAAPAAADITTVRARQRELGLPESFEWIHEIHPDLLAVARSAGLHVQQAPLMVLDPDALPPVERFADLHVRLLDPDSPGFVADLAAWFIVARAAFTPPSGPLSAAPTDSTAALPTVGVTTPELVTVTFPTVDSGVTHSQQEPTNAPPAPTDPTGADLLPESLVAQERLAISFGVRRIALADQPVPGTADPAPGTADPAVVGAAAVGSLNRVDDVAEIVGVGTLPRARRRGLASAVTATLARRALADGVDLVFLAAGDDDIAVLYHRLGFRRIGTACIAAP